VQTRPRSRPPPAAAARSNKIATTAIARKLLTRAYHLLTDAASDGAPS
jgi:hypothetical protein